MPYDLRIQQRHSRKEYPVSLEQQIATLTDEVKALSSSVSILTAAIVALAEVQQKAATGEIPEKPARRRKAVDPKAETEVIEKTPAAAESPAAATAPIQEAQAPAAGVAAHTDPPAETKTVGQHLADAQAKPVPTKEELIAKFQQLVAKFGKDAATEKARKIINDLGAANVSGIPEEKRALAIAAVDAELAGA